MALGTAPAADTSPELADSPTAVARRRDRRIEGSRRVAIVVEQSPISHLNMAKLNGVLGFIREHRAWQTRLFEVDVRREDLVRWKPDGVMIARDLPMPDLRVGDRAVPVVYFYDEPAHLDGYSVSQDEEHIGALAAGYFLDRGYGHFAYVGLPHRSFSQARGAAFLAALRRRGHDAAVVDLPRPKRDNRYSPPKALLKLPTPLAIFAANDNVALAVMELSHRRGRNVPQQWAVLGVDDITLLCEFSDPPLSSIIHPQVRVGRVAAEMLQTLMRGDTPPDAHLRIASPGVHTRRSTEAAAVDDPLVADAIRWMIRRINRPLTVTAAADDLNVSRNTLHRRFVNVLGHGMKREHRRQQILRAQELLQRTGDSLADIAVGCGFNDGAHFSRTFRAATGRTPAQYRAANKSPHERAEQALTPHANGAGGSP